VAYVFVTQEAVPKAPAAKTPSALRRSASVRTDTPATQSISANPEAVPKAPVAKTPNALRRIASVRTDTSATRRRSAHPPQVVNAESHAE